MSKAKVLMIGAGHLGSLLLKSWLKEGIVSPKQLELRVRSQESQKSLHLKFPKLRISCEENSSEMKKADIYILAVKPLQWAALRPQLQKLCAPKSLVVSIMAGIPPSQLEAELHCPCLVAMTNTSVQVGEALTSLFYSSQVTEAQKKWASTAFEALGFVTELGEERFATATAFGGSHPAFALWIMREISKILEERLPGQNGLEWTVQVFRGALKLLAKNQNVADLLKQIATPGGCTAEGLRSLEELGVSAQLREVFDRCEKKAAILAKK